MDKLSPGMAAGPTGNFRLLMSLRFTKETLTEEDTKSETPTDAIAA